MLNGVEIRTMPGVHVGDGLMPQLKKLLRYGLRSPRALAQILRATADTPRNAAVNAIALRMSGGLHILHAAETVHGEGAAMASPFKEDAHPLDLLLLGVEPGEEAACGRAIQAWGSVRTLLFSPHQKTRARFGLGPEVHWQPLLEAGPGVERAQQTSEVAP